MVDEHNQLLCPVCGFYYLHHYKVEVFERCEDEEKGLHVTVAGKTATIDENLTGNPSRRRDGLKVYFWCEGCPATSVLSISQHKGNTFVEFVKEAGDEEPISREDNRDPYPAHLWQGQP